MNVTRLCLGVLCALFIGMGGCGRLWPVERVEVARITSPDRRVEAVVQRTNAGGTAGYGYQVYVVPTGLEPDDEGLLLRADNAPPEGIRVQWLANRRLRIDVGGARIFQYQNFWHAREVDNWEYVVHTVLEGQAGRAADVDAVT